MNPHQPEVRIQCLPGQAQGKLTPHARRNLPAHLKVLVPLPEVGGLVGDFQQTGFQLTSQQARLGANIF